MKSTARKPLLDRASSVVWAIIAAIVAILLLFFLGEVGFIFLFGAKLGEPLAYITYGLFLGISSFIICRHNPKSVWYVVLVLNIFSILSLIGEYRSIMGIIISYMMLAIFLSILGGLWGARRGENKLKISTLQT